MIEFLKTGTTEEDFQQAVKQEAAKHLLQSIERAGASSRAHFLRTFVAIASSSHLCEDPV